MKITPQNIARVAAVIVIAAAGSGALKKCEKEGREWWRGTANHVAPRVLEEASKDDE